MNCCCVSSMSAPTPPAVAGGGSNPLVAPVAPVPPAAAPVNAAPASVATEPNFAVPGVPVTKEIPAPRRGGQAVDIAFLAQGYLQLHDTVNPDGALELGTAEVEKGVFVGDQLRWSTLAEMARAADAAGLADGSVTAAEFEHLLARFDTGDAGRAGTAGDGFLEGTEDAAWKASGLLPKVAPFAAATPAGAAAR